jgi:alpha-glucosidase
MSTDINSWLASQIVYEIFPERFAIGKSKTPEEKLAMKCYESYDPPYETRGWDQLPVNPSKGWDFFGGDLYGIVDHLDYLQELGVTTLFMTPIFSSPSNHKYDTTDFFTIDEQFCGKEALIELIKQLKQRDMHLFLDIAMNHVRDTHQWFLDAKRNKKPKRDFFTFGQGGSYLCWHDFRHQPELNLVNETLQGKLFRDSNSALQQYLDMGVDGFRFDAANDVGMPIINKIREALRQRFPNAVMIGEVTNFAGEWIDQNDKYHGVMNYYFHGALYAWLQGNISSTQLNYCVEEYYRGYGKKGAIYSWNILSSHDTPRLRNFLADKKQRKLAVVAQFTLPGVPFIYYGEEIGMAGEGDPDCRRPMIWDENQWDKEIFDFYRHLIAIRKSRAELQYGDFVMLGHKLSTDALAFLRHTEKPDEAAIIVINNSGMHLKQKLFVPCAHIYHQLRLKDLLSGDTTEVQIGGGIDLDIPPYTAVILVPDDTKFVDYKFFKPRNLLLSDL